MGVEQVYKVPDNDTQRALEHLHQQAVGVSYTKDEPTAEDVPAGKVVIYDNGSGTLRLYVKSGEKTVGYVTLTTI
jgi:hypothetical protein